MWVPMCSKVSSITYSNNRWSDYDGTEDPYGEFPADSSGHLHGGRGNATDLNELNAKITEEEFVLLRKTTHTDNS